MRIVKTILAVLAIIISVVFLLVCVAGIVGSWTINTPLTNTTTNILTGFERVLEVADNGLQRVDDRLGEAQTNVDTFENRVQEAGDTLSETSLVYEVLDRTVGDELFPKIETASETISSVAESLVAFNETLEALNGIPRVEVPTLTDELEQASQRMAEIQTDVEETRVEIRAIRAEKVSKPVNAITQRTQRISTGLENVQTTAAEVQANIDENQQSIAEVKESVPGFFDLISIVLTFIFGWLGLGQIGLIVLSWGVLRSPQPSKEGEADAASTQPKEEELAQASPQAKEEESVSESSQEKAEEAAEDSFQDEEGEEAAEDSSQDEEETATSTDQ